MKQAAILGKALSIFLKVSLILMGALIAFFLILAILHPLGALPEKLHPTIELPVHLYGLEKNYPVKALEDGYVFEHFELKKLEMEVRPETYSFVYFGVYLYAALYLGIFFGLTFLLHKLIQTFSSPQPFPIENVGRIRYMGYLLIILPLIRMTMGFFFLNGLKDKFMVEGGDILASPSWQQFDTLALVMAAVLLILAEVFRKGAELQDFEAQTV